MTLATLTPAFLDLAFVRGGAVGFALAAPMGPVAVLCIRRALARGRMQSFVAGLGAALADMVFGAVAGLGLTVVSAFIMNYEIVIGLVGGIVVLGLGITTYRTPVHMTDGRVAVKSLRRDFVAAFSMAITNPATMVASIGLFAAFGPIDIDATPGRAFWLVAGVLVGSALWWLILSGVVATLRGRFVVRGLPWLNKISGSVIAVSGAVVLTVAVMKVLSAVR